MKKILGLIVLTFMLSMVSGCSSTSTDVVLEEQPRLQPTNASTWSVFVYMSNNGSEKANAVMKELCTTDYPSNVNVVIQTSAKDDIYLQRLIPQKGSLCLKDQEPMASMGSYETLQSYLSWGIENYPADNYMLLLVGDGTGTEVLMDANFGNDGLNVEELSYAVSLSGQRFDIIGFDTSHSASIELASALSPYAGYMIASEEKCAGFDYESLKDCLFEYSHISPHELCQVICDDYYAKCVKNNCEQMATLSAIDLSQVTLVTQAFDGMADMMADTTDSLDAYGALARNVLAAQECIGSDGMIDLGSMAVAIASNVGETAQGVLEAISQAVIYNVRGELRPNATGLCVYYPQELNEAKLNQYMTDACSNNYKHFIKCISPDIHIQDKFVSGGYEESWAWCDYVGREFSCGSAVDANSKYMMQINGDINIVKDARLKKYYYYGESNAFYSLGEDNNLVCDWTAQTYVDNSEYKIPKLRSTMIQMDLADEVIDKGKIYTVPVIMNDEVGEIIVYHPWNTEKYKITGVWLNGSLIKPGYLDKITPIHNIRGDSETWLTGKTVVGGLGFRIRSAAYPKGSYVYEYELEDIYSKLRIADPAAVTKTSEEITIVQ